MRLQCLAALVFAPLLSAAAARATTFKRMNLDQLVVAADAVVQAECLGNETRWEIGELWTFTRFEVLETLKGVVPRLITVRLLGGKRGHLISTVEGVPRFHRGEEVILFLERTRAGNFSVTSWMQGTFRIRRDAAAGQARVSQDSSGLAVFDPRTQRFDPTGVRNLPLETFRKRLAAAVERGKNRRPQ